MPTAVSLPSCLMYCYRALYPRLDFSRVGFYSGLPTFISGPDGFTMASGAASPAACTSKTTSPAGRRPSRGRPSWSSPRTGSRHPDSGHAGRGPHPGLVDGVLYVAEPQLRGRVVDLLQRAGERGLSLHSPDDAIIEGTSSTNRL
jgi:hypothetical protein